MDNTWPVIQLKVDDGGDCTKYAKGDTIKGNFYVYDKNINIWNFGSTWGDGTADPSGLTNTVAMPGNNFEIATTATAYPCGNIYLNATDKTILDSQSVGHHSNVSYNVCLKEKK